MRRERDAVVEAGLGPQQEAVGESIGRYPHSARHQPIHRVGLIVRRREEGRGGHQGRKRRVDTERAVALEDEDVEGVEGEEVLVELPRRPELREQAAFRRVGIDVIEMLETGGIFEIAEDRHAVAFGFIRSRCRRERARAAERTDRRA